jgi:hypothetical protein
MSSEKPNASSPETPPLAPYDPPAPAPQAAAWRRALKVVGYTPPTRPPRLIKSTVVKTTVTKTPLRPGNRTPARPVKWM